ncbi:MAG: S8 family serine peptidase [Bacteroidota bacterium]|nr:S8 family serine peptidase [Bacteroidota bacterium]
MAKNNFFFLAVFILISFEGFSADRYVVYFLDKLNTPYNTGQPEVFLSNKAIERRFRQNIEISDTDFPVNPQYVSEIRPLATAVHYKSRWFNAVLVEADNEQIEEIKKLPFVQKVDYVALGPQDSRRVRRDSRPKINQLKRTANNSSFQNQLLGVDIMHEAGFKGEGIIIGVFDGGFMNVDSLNFFSHIFKNDRIVYTYDFVRNDSFVYDFDRHGTEVLSTIGAYKENEIVGAAYNADFILCITEEVVKEYRVEEYNWLFAAEAADSAGVDIINSSLGYNTFSDPSMDYRYEDLDGKTAVITVAANMATQKGILIVSSAGNEGNKAWKYITAPADAEGVLTVGSVNSNSELSSFSSIGPTVDGRLKPDVVALGNSAVVGKIDGSIGVNNGTSFSSPQVAGLAAGILQANRDLTTIQLLQKIRMSGTHAVNPNNKVGYGVPNFVRAQNNIVLSVGENRLKRFKIYPNPANAGEIFISADENMPKGLVNLKIHSSSGQLLLDKNIQLSTSSKAIPININNIPPGLYGVTISTKKYTEKVKIIKN